MPVSNKAWDKIFKDYCLKHDFDKKPFCLTANMIKDSTRQFRETKDREVRIICKIDSREDLPTVLKKRNLFLLPTNNGVYAIIKGEGFHDIEPIEGMVEDFKSKLNFELKSAKIGTSEMQYLDYAFNTGLINHFLGIEEKICLQIRGRKRTPNFKFNVGKFALDVTSVQTEVDAGYEGNNIIILIEAKNAKQANFIIRQLYYPYRQWKLRTGKKVFPLFFSFQPTDEIYQFWHYGFGREEDYDSIKLVKTGKFKIVA